MALAAAGGAAAGPVAAVAGAPGDNEGAEEGESVVAQGMETEGSLVVGASRVRATPVAMVAVEEAEVKASEEEGVGRLGARAGGAVDGLGMAKGAAGGGEA